MYTECLKKLRQKTAHPSEESFCNAGFFFKKNILEKMKLLREVYSSAWKNKPLKDFYNSIVTVNRKVDNVNIKSNLLQT